MDLQKATEPYHQVPDVNFCLLKLKKIAVSETFRFQYR